MRTRLLVPRAVILLVAAVIAAAACTPPSTGPSNKGPLAMFSPSVSSGPAPLAVTFDATASNDPDGTIVGYSWDFGDFTTGSGQIVNHTFPAGSFTVKLTVTDNKGATASSTTVISASGPPAAPTGLTKVGSGCCDTYGDFSWNMVPGATAYEVSMDGYFLGGCLTDHSDVINGQVGSGRVQAFGLCLGSKYYVKIRAQANGLWGPWSPDIHITL